jgi:hypothetical protein
MLKGARRMLQMKWQLFVVNSSVWAWNTARFFVYLWRLCSWGIGLASQATTGDYDGCLYKLFFLLGKGKGHAF